MTDQAATDTNIGESAQPANSHGLCPRALNRSHCSTTPPSMSRADGHGSGAETTIQSFYWSNGNNHTKYMERLAAERPCPPLTKNVRDRDAVG